MGNYFSNRWTGYQRKRTVNENPKLKLKDVIARLLETKAMFTRPTAAKKAVFTWYEGRIAYCNATLIFSNLDGKTPELKISGVVVGKQIRQQIKFAYTPVHFGGVRWWFVCPKCNRRCGCLHLTAPRFLFACRECHDLSYISTQEAHKHDRGRFGKVGRLILLERRYDKIYNRMSKHARWTKAYRRNLAQIEKIERELDTLAGINMLTGDGV